MRPRELAAGFRDGPKGKGRGKGGR